MRLICHLELNVDIIQHVSRCKMHNIHNNICPYVMERRKLSCNDSGTDVEIICISLLLGMILTFQLNIDKNITCS